MPCRNPLKSKRDFIRRQSYRRIERAPKRHNVPEGAALSAEHDLGIDARHAGRWHSLMQNGERHRNQAISFNPGENGRGRAIGAKATFMLRRRALFASFIGNSSVAQ